MHGPFRRHSADLDTSCAAVPTVPTIRPLCMASVESWIIINESRIRQFRRYAHHASFRARMIRDMYASTKRDARDGLSQTSHSESIGETPEIAMNSQIIATEDVVVVRTSNET